MRLLISLLLTLSMTVNATPAFINLAHKKFAAGCGGTVGTAGDFDYFVFTQSWSAQFCASHNNYTECETPTEYMQHNLTLHGMWPQYTSPRISASHLWPQCCASQYGTKLNHTVIQQLLPGMQEYWPNEQDPTGNSDASLWAHEWTKHGTCSGLSPYGYFNGALTLAASAELTTPDAITKFIGNSTSRSQLESAYNNGAPCDTNQPCFVALACTGGYLSEVTTCWTRDLERMECPSSLEKNTCDDTISIRSYKQY